MYTFRQFISESAVKTAASLALMMKIYGLNRQVQQDRTATTSEKTLSSEIALLAAINALGIPGEKK
jgi:hypothetical protein